MQLIHKFNQKPLTELPSLMMAETEEGTTNTRQRLDLLQQLLHQLESRVYDIESSENEETDEMQTLDNTTTLASDHEQCQKSPNPAHKDWIALPAMPEPYFSNPVIIEPTQFIVAPHINATDPEQESGYLYTYDVTLDEWTKFAAYPIPFHCKHPSLCLNSETKELYLYGSLPSLLKIDLNTKQTEDISSKHAQLDLISAGMYAQTCFIDGEYHLIAGHRNRKHVVLRQVGCHKDKDIDEADECEYRFEQIHEFQEWRMGNIDPGFVNVTSKKKLLLFGGFDYGTSKILDDVWMFDYGCTQSMKRGWSKIASAELPDGGSKHCGYALSKDEKFVLIFGGNSANEQYLDDIYIVDIQNIEEDKVSIRKSEIKCPVKDIFHAMLMPQNATDEILVFGAIKEWEHTVRAEHMPHDIILLVLQWFSSDFVHLLKDNAHWKIPINALLG